MAYTVTVRQRWPASGRARRVIPQGLGGVGEVQASDGGDLEPAGLDAAMAAVAGAVGDGDLVPRQGDELLVEGGLVVLDDQQPGGVLVGDQPVGVLALGVQRIGGGRAGSCRRPRPPNVDGGVAVAGWLAGVAAGLPASGR
jgi:hypothetical protein